MPDKKKCPPFCNPDTCDIVHHKLIVRLINIREKEKRSLEKFKSTLAHYRDILPQDQPIPDDLKEYRYPVLHWASVLGKISAVEYLINEGYKPTVRSHDKGETALHRVALCFHQQFNKYKQVEQTQRFKTLTELLAPALFVKDDNGNTPLHICAIYVAQYEALFYRTLLEVMIDKVVDMEDRGLSKTDGINMRNREGKTILHILAAVSSEKYGALVGKLLVEKLMSNGADPENRNYEGKSALDIAEERSNEQMFEVMNQKRSRKRKRNNYAESGQNSSTSQKQGCEEQSATILKVTHEHNLVSSTTNKDDSDDKDMAWSRSKKPVPNIRPSLVGTASACSDETLAERASSSATVGPSTKANIVKSEPATESNEENRLPMREREDDSTPSAPDQQSTDDKPKLEQLLKRVNQDGSILEIIEQKRQKLEANCKEIDLKMADLEKRRCDAQEQQENITKDIKVKMNEFKILEQQLIECTKGLKAIDKSIEEEIDTREKIANTLSDYEVIIKRLADS